MMNNVPDNVLRKERSIDVESEINKIIEKRIRTAFIYPIDQLEQIFGELWGEMKSENDPMTKDEEKYEEMFIKWRKAILDVGNLQIRIAKNEIRKVLG